MTMKKKVLTTLSVVLILGMAAMGILAYLTSQDSDVNVMTLGNVSIEQHEYQRAENADGTYKTDTIDGQTSYVLEDFEQAKPLLPIVGDPSTGAAGWDATTVRMSQVDSYGGMQVFAGKVAQDKFVVVENNGKSDAYVRTLVAVEVGSTNGSLVGTSYHKTWTKNDVGIVEIDNNNYYVTEYVYAGGELSDGSWRHEKGILPAGDTAYPNLSQVYIKSAATNEDCDAIDGNKNGTCDILVLSQAVQTSGFDNAQQALDTAFGTAAAKAAEWFGGTAIPNVFNAEQFEAVLSTGGEIILGDDIDLNKSITIPSGKTVVLDLNGKSIISNKNQAIINKGDLTVNGDGTIEGAAYAIFNISGTLTLNGGTYKGSTYGIAANNNCTLNGNISNTSFSGCTVNGGEYTACSFTGFTTYGGTFTDCIFDSNGSYQGGTFDFNPDNVGYVPFGPVVDNGDGTWTIVIN